MFYFDKKHRYVSVICVSTVIIFSMLGFHGFSIGYWGNYLEGSRDFGILWGNAQGIRSDDWLAILPNVMAQIYHNPAFPVINKNIGTGQNMIFYPHMPVAHPLALFRPTTWGYFLSFDFGLGWQWYFRVMGTFYSAFLLFLICTRGWFWGAFFSGIVLTFSPFLQFWSLNCAEMVMSAIICIAAVYLIRFAKRRRGIFWGSLLLGWAGAVFVLSFYPPYQIPLGYMFICLTLTLLIRDHSQLSWRFLGGTRLAALCLASLIVAIAALNFYVNTSDDINKMLNTVYPGKRQVAGGDVPLWQFFSNSFYFFNHKNSLARLGNICEAASFYFVFPISMMAIVWRVNDRKVLMSYFPVFVLTVAICWWKIFGFPQVLANATLFSMVPTKRIDIALGLLNICWLLFALQPSAINVDDISRSKLLITIISLAWGALTYIIGKNFHHASGLPIIIIINCSILATIFAAGQLLSARWFLPLFALMCVLQTGWFNPFSRGGERYLLNSALAKSMLEIKRKNPGSRWVVFNDFVYAQLPRMFGVGSLGGQQYVPFLDQWQILDPGSRYNAAYNRYGHVFFRAKVGSETTISSDTPDVIQVTIAPNSEVFKKLGVDFAMVIGDSDTFFSEAKVWRPLFSVGNKWFFEKQTN